MAAARGTTWEERLAPLVEHRQWALIGRYGSYNAAQVAASNLRTGKVQLPKGHWRFVARRLKDGAEQVAGVDAVLYGRYTD
jgi:hypothetical protein